MSNNMLVRVAVLAAVAIAASSIIYVKITSEAGSSGKTMPTTTVNEPENAASQASSPGASALSKALKSGKPTMILFHSNSCAPCKEMSAIIEAVKTKHGDSTNFIDILVDDPAEQDFINQHGVSSIPTSVFYDKTGKRLGTQIGVIEQEQLAGMLSDMEK